MLSYIKNTMAILCALLLFNSSHSYAGDSVSIGVEMLKSVVINVEKELGISFDGGGASGAYAIKVVEGATGLGAVSSSPAFIKITGATAEVMIDIENNMIRGYDDNSEAVISISDFKILDGEAGNSVVITPFSGEDFFIFSIGGTVAGSKILDSFYTGANIINVNYL